MLHDRVAMLLLVVAAVVATASPGVAIAADTTTTRGHQPLLVDCAPAPSPALSADGDRAFRANLALALAALPSAAAAAPRGTVVTARAYGGISDRAFARGLCFVANGSSSSTAGACRACLAAAARDVARGCLGGANSRRAGAWRAECFVAYADTAAATTGREDSFRASFFAAGPPGPGTAAKALAHGKCMGGRSAAHCARCLESFRRAAQQAAGWLPRLRGDAVVVVGYRCFVRVNVAVPPDGKPGPRSTIESLRASLFTVWVVSMIGLEAGVLGSMLRAIIEVLREEIPLVVQ